MPHEFSCRYRQAAFDRPAVLHEHAGGSDLIAESRLRPRSVAVTEHASRGLQDVYADGGTTYLGAVDSARMGFSLQAGKPAEYGPGGRPRYTLTPMAVSRGYTVVTSPPGDQAFGHAQAIRVTEDGMLTGAADPRAGDGALAGR